MTRVSKGLSIPLIKPLIPYYVIDDDTTDPGVGDEIPLIDLSFVKQYSYDWDVKLVESMPYLNETFDSDNGQFEYLTESTAGTVTISDNSMIFSHTGEQNDVVIDTNKSFTIPTVWVQSDIETTTDSATSYDNGGVGIAKDADNFIFASVDRIAGVIRTQVKINGSNSFYDSNSESIGTSFSLGLSLAFNSVCVWIDQGSGFELMSYKDIESIKDMKEIDALSGWHPSITVANGGGSTVWEFSNLKAGSYGGVGVRDCTIFTNTDGSPYFEDGNKIYFSGTTPDPLGVSFASVFKMNVDDYSFEKVSTIAVNRDSKIENDLIPHVLISESQDDNKVTMSSWGNDFGGDLFVSLSTVSDLSILSNETILSGMVTLDLPNVPTNGGCYDQMLAYDENLSRWIITYSITTDTDFSGDPFYAAAAYSSDLSTWTAIGADSGNTGYEGTKIVKINDTYNFVAGGEAGTGDNSRVYDYNMNYLGDLGIVFEGGSVTQPHPMIFPYGDKQICLTFDESTDYSSSFTWGDLIIYEADRYE